MCGVGAEGGGVGGECERGGEEGWRMSHDVPAGAAFQVKRTFHLETKSE